MLQTYINQLVNNIPNKYLRKLQGKTNNPLKVDLVFEGGLFNGSYQIGFLNYIKQMEKKQFLKVERVSGCSIGSVMAFLYFTNILIFDNYNIL